MPHPDPLPAFRNFLERYGPLPDASFAVLREGVSVQSYEKRTYLLRHGEVSTTRYYVHSGLIVAAYLAGSGKLYYKNFFTAGGPAGSIASVLQGTPSDFSLLTLEPTVVVAYDDAYYRGLVETDPAINRQYRRYLEESWVIRNEQRHLAFATQTAGERYRTFLSDYPDLEQRISQHHIASYLGITPTQLSRIRHKFYHDAAKP